MGFGPGPEDDRNLEGEAFTQRPLKSMLTQLVRKKNKAPDTNDNNTLGSCIPQSQETTLICHPHQSHDTRIPQKEEEESTPQDNPIGRLEGTAFLRRPHNG